MLRKIIAWSAFFLSVLFLAAAGDIKARIAAAQGREKLALILQFFQSSGQAPNEEEGKESLDSYVTEALALSRQLHDRHAEGTAQKIIAHGEYLRQQYEPALEAYFQSRFIFRELADRREEADIDAKIGDLFSIMFHVFSDFGRAGAYYAGSLALARQNENQAEITQNLINLADIYRAQDDFRRAIPPYLEALQLSERYDTHSDAGALLSSLSDMCLKTGDSAASVKYMRQALVFYEKKRQTQGQSRVYSQKGFLYMQQNDFAQALANFQQALAIHEKLSEPARTAGELRNLGRLYSQFKQDAKAQEYFRQERELRQKLSDRNEIIRFVLAKAVAWQKQNELAKAEALLLFCENRARQNHLQLRLEEIYLQMASLYGLHNDPAKALYYQTLGKKSKNSLPGATMAASIQKILAKHESDKEIDHIKLQKRRQSIAGMLAIGLLVALIGLLAAKRKSIRRWARSHMFSKDQQLQKKQAQLLGMGQKLRELQKQPAPRHSDAPPAGPDDRGREYLRLVLLHMKQDKLFLDSELTLKKMAARVGANTSSLSKALNDNLGMGFSDFINHFRIAAAKEIMEADDRDQWDVVDICYEVGFNSLSSFYRVFKMHTGLTPTEFQRGARNH